MKKWFVLFNLTGIVLFASFCSNRANSGSTADKHSKKDLVWDSSQIDNLPDTVKIACVVFYSPDGETLQHMQDSIAEDSYNEIIMDNEFYEETLTDALTEMKIPYYKAEMGKHTFWFKKFDGTCIIIDVRESEIKNWGVVLFNPSVDPKISSAALKTEELKTFFEK